MARNLQLVCDDAAGPAADHGEAMLVSSVAMPCAHAVAEILLRYRARMRAHQAAVMASDDDTPLHDFRVTMRRSRSLLASFKQVFGDRHFRDFRVEFAWLSAGSSRMRDLDVMLHGIDRCVGEYAAITPQQRAVLRQYLCTERARERRKLLRALKSRRYERFQYTWESRLRYMRENAPARHGADPVGRAGDAAVRLCLRKVYKRTEELAEVPPMTALHDLRKQCKRLRYVIEALLSLYDAERLQAVLSDLKRLQTKLGHLCDRNVQQALVATWLQRDADMGDECREAFEALQRQWADNNRSGDIAAAMLALRRFADEKGRRCHDEIFGQPAS